MSRVNIDIFGTLTLRRIQYRYLPYQRSNTAARNPIIVDKTDVLWYNSLIYMTFCGGKPSVNNTETQKKLLPGRVSLVTAAVLSGLFTALSTVLYNSGVAVPAGICFIVASSLLSFLFVFVRKPTVLTVPLLSFAAGFALCRSIALVCAATCGVVLFAALYAVCHIRLLPSFRQFFVTAGAFSLVGAILFCIIIYSVYGALGEGIVALGERLAREASSVASLMQAEGADYETASYVLEELFSKATVYLPAVIASLGVACAWLMRGVFSLYTRLSGIPSLFVGRASTAPRALAVIYLLCSFGGIAASFASSGFAYALSNVTMILSFVFLGEGVRFLGAFIVRCVITRRHALFVVSVILGLFFFTAAFAVFLPYCGAFGVLLLRRRMDIR